MDYQLFLIKLNYGLRRWKENAVIWIVWHLPRSWCMWAFFRIMAHATTGKYGMDSPDSVTWSQALNRWETTNKNIRIGYKMILV